MTINTNTNESYIDLKHLKLLPSSCIFFVQSGRQKLTRQPMSPVQDSTPPNEGREENKKPPKEISYGSANSSRQREANRKLLPAPGWQCLQHPFLLKLGKGMFKIRTRKAEPRKKISHSTLDQELEIPTTKIPTAVLL